MLDPEMKFILDQITKSVSDLRVDMKDLRHAVDKLATTVVTNEDCITCKNNADKAIATAKVEAARLVQDAKNNAVDKRFFLGVMAVMPVVFFAITVALR